VVDYLNPVVDISVRGSLGRAVFADRKIGIGIIRIVCYPFCGGSRHTAGVNDLYRPFSNLSKSI
jgi:hypothetical protein